MAKQQVIELEVDVIGSQKSILTEKEEKAISEFIRSRKARNKSKVSKDKIEA